MTPIKRAAAEKGGTGQMSMTDTLIEKAEQEVARLEAIGEARPDSKFHQIALQKARNHLDLLKGSKGSPLAGLIDSFTPPNPGGAG